MSEKEPTGEPSIEEIEAEQRVHEESVLEEKRKAEEEAERERQLKAQAGEDYGKRQDLLAALRETDAEAKKLEAEGIKERMAQAERLKGLKTEREATLEGLQAEIQQAADRLKQIEGLVAGKSEEMVAEATRKALAAARAKFQDLDGQTRTLAGEIEKIGEQIVSDEMVKKYQALLSASSELNDQIDEISSNPALVELMGKEAIDENKVRNEIVRAAISQCQRQYGVFPTDERRAFIAQLAETFITEEFQAKEIDQIKDPQERARAMNAWRIRVADGIINGDYEKIARMDPQEQTDRWPGLVLRNLVGGHGTLGGTMHLMVTAEIGHIRLGGWEGRDTDRERENTPTAVRRYLRTLNLVKAYDEGMATNRLRSEVVGHTADNWEEFDRRFQLGRDFDNPKKGPLMPRDVDPRIKKQLAEEYEQNKAKAQKIEEALTKATEEVKQRELAEIEAQLVESKDAIVQLTQAEEVLRNLKYGEAKDLDRDMTSLQGGISGRESTIRSLEQEMQETGALSFRQRGRISREISENRSYLAGARERLRQNQTRRDQITKAQELINKYGSSSDLRLKISQLETRKQRLERGY